MVVVDHRIEVLRFAIIEACIRWLSCNHRFTRGRVMADSIILLLIIVCFIGYVAFFGD